MGFAFKLLLVTVISHRDAEVAEKRFTIPSKPKKKPSCSLRDLDDVTLGGSAVFFKLRFGISQCYVPFEDPWLSAPTSRWVWV